MLPRPHLHFTPPQGWLNDPNGLVYLDGEYHLFYQHHPDAPVWGPMYWGHAVSRDLLHWEHLPIALEPDASGTIFSGSAVIDHQNTAGFGPGAMVLIFTHNAAGRQVQSLAFSTDRGRSFTKYAHNPVLAPPDAPRDFRDPRVFWHTTGASGFWVMLLAVGLEIWIYRSPDLKRWERSGVFHAGSNPADGVWECPELLHLPVDGGPERRWVLIVSVQYGAPAGGCGTRYFVGQFDGASFTCPDPPEQARWADFGADFYAPQAWNDAPDGRAIWVAWMSNWAYAGVTPTSSTRGVMSLPRELGLGTTPDGLALVQRPVRELAALRGEAQRYADLLLQPGEALHLGGQGDALEALIELRADTSAGGQLVLQFGADDDAAIAVRYDPLTALLSLRRGHVDWHGAFANAQSAPLAPRDGLLRLQLVLDTGSLELFADEGRLVLSNQIFPAAHQSLTLCAEGGPVRVAAVQVTSYTNALNT